MDPRLPYYMAYPMPLIYDDSRIERQDFEYMKSMYPELAKKVIPLLIEKIPTITNFVNDEIFATLSGFATELELKSKTLFYIMRIAITGLEVTPGGATEIAEILGKNECIARLNASLQKTTAKTVVKRTKLFKVMFFNYYNN